MDKTVKFRIELESNGKRVLHDVTVSSDELRGALIEMGKEARNSLDDISSLAQMSMMFDASINVIEHLRTSINGLADDWNSFDKGMRAVNTMAGKNAEDLGKLKDQVAALGNEIPKTKEELSAGLYQVISNGVPEDNWISFLEQSAKASVGGIADLGQTVTVTSTIIKNYGLEWGKAGEIQDKIQMTAKNGVTSFEQLAAALPRVSGNAATLGVSIDELMATFATLTGVSGNTAEVSTQLAAVFTSLVKPSSEASKMAEEMGIQFDAAAIRAQGGMRNFLTQLDADITKYASAHNMLKEEIYGKLFGSAESLRALIPLTGELSSKFSENVDAMADSAGTVEGSFGNMAGSGEAVTQMLRNQLSTMLDWAGSIASAIQPYLTFVAIGGQAFSGIMLLGKAIATATSAVRSFSAVMLIQRNAVLRSAAAHLVFAGNARRTAAAIHVMANATRSAATAAVAAKVAIRGLLVATGVGAAIAALGFAVEKLVDYFSDAGNAAGDAAEEFDEAADRAQRAQEAFANEESRVFSDLMSKYQQLAASWKALSKTQEKTEWIKKHKTAFEELSVSINSIADADYFFVKNGNAVVESIKKRAKAMADLAQLTELYRQQSEIQQKIAAGTRSEAITYKAGDVWHSSVSKNDTERGYIQLGKDGNWHLTAAGAQAKSGIRIIESAEVKGLRDELSKLNANIDALANKTATDSKTDTSLVTRPNAPDSDKNKGNDKKTGSEGNGEKKLIVNAKSSDDLQNNIDYYTQEINKLGIEDRAKIDELTRKQADVQKKFDELEKIKQASRDRLIEPPVVPTDDFKVIEKLDDEIKSYDQLNERLTAFTKRLEKAGDSERKVIMEQIHALNPLFASTDTLAGIDQAIQFYTERQQHEDAEHIQATQEIIDKLTAKRAALLRGGDLQNQLKEAIDINSLSGREYRVKVSGMGFDELTDKLRDLHKLLNDTENPVMGAQRKDIEALIKIYEKWRRESVKSMDTVKKGWSSLKGVGDSVQGITDALKGNGNAWEKVTSVINGVLQLYDSFAGIIEIINMLTQATQGHAVAKEVEAGAVAAGAAAEVGASTSVAEANIAEANTAVTAAAAETMKAHAGIPWVGIAIGAGMVATMLGLMFALPKFADGGMVYGPTLGLFGEYAGASNNPEVVAPLSKLKGMLSDVVSPTGGRVVFKIDGRTLMGVLEKERTYRSRTR